MGSMKADYLSYKDTNSFSKTFLAYLDKDPEMLEFIQNWPSMESLYEQISKKESFPHRETLVEVLKDQYHSLNESQKVSAKVQENIQALRNKKTFTITTGHQLSLFTGPLYFLYKIASVIRLTQDLKQAYKEYDFVPVFWMASEDHDFAEINHTFYDDTKISWDVDSFSGTGRLKTDTIASVVKKYTQILGLQGYSNELKTLVEEAYLGNSNLADATRCLVNSLFGEFGLVVIDGDEKRLKTCFAPIIEEDILCQHSNKQVQETNHKLLQKNYQTQVFSREINFFYLKDEFRERIQGLSDGNFEVKNQNVSFTPEEIKTEIKNHPERFSPNVIMRPVYQEVVLPNLAYIGGGAEVVYWMQLKGVFDHYKIPFPLLLSRNSAVIMEEKKYSQWERLGFTHSDLFKKTEELIRELVEKNTTHVLNLQNEISELDRVFQDMKIRVGKVEPTLISSTEAVQKRLYHALSNLEKKLLKAEKKNHSQGLESIQSIKQILYPMGNLQERHQNMAKYYVLMGPDFIQQLIQHLNPLDFRFTLLKYNRKKD